MLDGFATYMIEDRYTVSITASYTIANISNIITSYHLDRDSFDYPYK